MLDEFDIESYRFKPVNKGLGFHEKAQNRLVAHSVLQSSLEKRLDRESSMNGGDSLKAFYEAPVVGNKKIFENSVVDNDRMKDFLQFFGWLVDVFFVCMISLVTIVGLGFVAHFFGRTSLEVVVMTFTQTNGVMSVGVLFSITYLLYFTYGDIGTSLGKTFFGVKLVAKSGEQPTSRMTLVRSLATLFSLSLLGIPALFDFQGKLSDTKIVKV